jgi:hypothetical protein
LPGFNSANTLRKTINLKALYGGFFYVWHSWYGQAPKNGLKRAFMAFGGHFLAQSTDGFIQCVYFFHFVYSPSPLLSMPTKNRISVAINAQGYTGILQALFVMMCLAWP